MKPPLRIGLLTFVPSPSDYGAIRVDIVTPSDRDFITLEPAEWQSLTLAVLQLELSAGRVERDRVEIVRTQLQRDAAQKRLDDLRQSLGEMRADCHRTYGGGYKTEREAEIFHHGMATVCNIIDVLLERTGGKEHGHGV